MLYLYKKQEVNKFLKNTDQAIEEIVNSSKGKIKSPEALLAYLDSIISKRALSMSQGELIGVVAWNIEVNISIIYNKHCKL